MNTKQIAQPDWVVRGKSIRQLVKELQSFDNQDLLVEILLDGGATHKPINLIKKVWENLPPGK